MATRNSINFINNVSFTGSSFVGSSSTQAQAWVGGRSALVVNALAYGGAGGLGLQIQGAGGAWATTVLSSIISDGMYVLDTAPGQYRLVENASSSIGVSAVLVPIPYNL